MSFIIALVSFATPLTILVVKEIAKSYNKSIWDSNTSLIALTTILGLISLGLFICLIYNIIKIYKISWKGFGISVLGSGFETSFEHNSDAKINYNENVIYKILKYFQSFIKDLNDKRMYFCFYAFNKNDEVLVEYKKCLKSFLKTLNINIELIDGELVNED